MSKNDREQDKTLQKEAKQRSTDNSEDSDFLYVVCGPPGTQKIIKVKKRATNPEKEINLWCTKADVLTKDKLIELNHRIKMAKHKPNIITISEVKRKNFKREFNVAEYMLDGYSIEPLDIGEHKGRGMIMYVHYDLKNLTCTILNLIFKKHNFDV